ncbi:hypothetical protein J437_LFUL012838 [Ladona fulva]|uniref:Uncharacterized protein n=1 Tax=Ladona fulva TaxID=123851 RepID=A0A8K0KJW9_LADFU|nr:hypothetical protein J437_LFUL012838 [Ladona fulva]
MTAPEIFLVNSKMAPLQPLPNPYWTLKGIFLPTTMDDLVPLAGLLKLQNNTLCRSLNLNAPSANIRGIDITLGIFCCKRKSEAHKTLIPIDLFPLKVSFLKSLKGPFTDIWFHTWNP